MRRLRNAFVLGVAVGLVVAVLRRLLDPPTPPPTPIPAPGSTPRPSSAPRSSPPAKADSVPTGATTVGDDASDATSEADTLDAAPRTVTDDRDTGTGTTGTGATSDATPGPGLADSIRTAPAGAGIERAPTRALEPAPTHDLETTWSPPVDGACPPGFPVKAKESSRIFHVPGGLSYDRTRPDRCYPTPEAAEADGFRPAQR